MPGWARWPNGLRCGPLGRRWCLCYACAAILLATFGGLQLPIKARTDRPGAVRHFRDSPFDGGAAETCTDCGPRAQAAPPPQPPPQPSPQSAVAPKPAFPADLEQWSLADFVSARAVGEPRLTAAVSGAWSTPGAVWKKRPCSPRYWRRAGPIRKEGNKSAELTRALVDALVANGTPMAQGSLVGLVDGSLPVPEDHGAAWEASLTALATGRPDTEELVVRAIMAPEELRPSLRGPAAEELRRAALAAVRAGGSPQLRLRLAKAAIDPRYPSAVRKPVQSLLSENVDENLEAMTLMFGSSTLADDVRKDTEKRLLTSGNRLIAGDCGFPWCQSRMTKRRLRGRRRN